MRRRHRRRHRGCGGPGCCLNVGSEWLRAAVLVVLNEAAQATHQLHYLHGRLGAWQKGIQ
jgi:hypothetical protein